MFTRPKISTVKSNIKYLTVPPHINRSNKAERAIYTLNNHLKAGLATVDPDGPIHERDSLISKVELTLNLLRASRVNPKLSAWAYLFGQFDWVHTSLVPPGKNVLVHLKSDNRSNWAPNG